jgi:type IX secretion system PorP/SprF family membrane protein
MTRKLRHIILFGLLISTLAVKQALGQEFPWSLQYISNMHTINPAFVGMWDLAGFTASTRKDYTSIRGAQAIQYLSYRTPVKDHESGWALNITKRNVGREKQLFFTGDYSYQVRFDMHHYLRLGLRVGFVNYDNNLTDYQLYPDNIPDPEFQTDLNMHFMTVFGVGGIFFTDNYYISFSVPQVINNTFKVNRTGYSSLQEFKTAYLAGGHMFRLPMGILARPNVLIVGTVGKPVFFDFAGVIYLPNNLQFGLNMRTNGAVCLNAQYTFGNGIRIGYAADYALWQDIRKFQFGTHEILIGYDFNLYRKAGRPNYF